MVKHRPSSSRQGQNQTASATSRLEEELPLDLFRERIQYSKRTNSNYQLGSNIQCLHSHDLGPDEPPKHPVRVRDIGREILINANKCSWYQGMMDESEAEDQSARWGSKVNCGTTQPLSPANNSDATKPEPVQANLSPEMNVSDSSLKAPYVGTALEQPPTSCDSSPIVADKVIDDGYPKQELSTITTMANSNLPLSSVCSDALSEANMCLLKRLEEQQLELMKQQQALCEQLGKHLPNHDHGEAAMTNASKNASSVHTQLESQPEIQPQPHLLNSKQAGDFPCSASPSAPLGVSITASIIPSASMARYDVAGLRRLKGALAQRCAQRDEGSIKNLIWYRNDDIDAPTNNSNTFGTVNCQRSPINNPAPKKSRNPHASMADSSKSVQDCLRNSYSTPF